MKIEKKLFVLINGKTAIGSAVVERVGERASCALSFPQPFFGRLMIDGDLIFDINGETKKQVSFTCFSVQGLRIYLYDGKHVYGTEKNFNEWEVRRRFEEIENKSKTEKQVAPEEKGILFGAECSQSDDGDEEEKEDVGRIEVEEYCDEAIAQENYYPSNLTFVDDLLDFSMSKADKKTETSDTSGQKRDLFVHNIKEYTTRKEVASTLEPRIEKSVRSILEGGKDGDGEAIVAQGGGCSVVRPGRRADFYESVKFRIDELFSKFERDSEMERLMPDTRWVKINYGNGRFYLVGTVGTKPDFVCYAVPGSYSPIPPACFSEGASFLPLDVRKPQGDGYWLIFQSARTGKVCLT